MCSSGLRGVGEVGAFPAVARRDRVPLCFEPRTERLAYDVGDTARVVVLSHAAWRERFADAV